MDTSRWRTSGSNTYVANGNVGIGSTAPSQALDLGTGAIAMGWELISNTCTNSNNFTASCTGTKRALGGSCVGVWNYSAAYSGATYYNCTTSASVSSLVVYVHCANIR